MSILVNPRKVFVVIPAFSEHTVIKGVLQQILPYEYNIVVVDDGSYIPLEPFLCQLPVFLLRHQVNLGQGAALQTGIDFAIEHHAAYIVTFDADGQHQPGDIAVLLETLENDKLDIVSGSRFLRGALHNMSFTRKILVHIARYINYVFTGMLLTDAHNGLRAFRSGAASKIQLRENGMAHATEILSIIRKKKLRHAEVPVHIRYTDYSRQKGQSGWNSFRILIDILLNKIFR